MSKSITQLLRGTSLQQLKNLQGTAVDLRLREIRTTATATPTSTSTPGSRQTTWISKQEGPQYITVSYPNIQFLKSYIFIV